MTKTQVNLLVKALEKEFGGKAEFEAVDKRSGQYRFAITTKRFDKMPHLTRQDRIWEVLDRVLPREAVLDVSMILAYSTADLAEMA